MMRCILIVVAAVCLASVLGEKCDHDYECHHLTCTSDYEVRCHDDQCTCSSKCAGDDKCESKQHCEHEALKHNCRCGTEMHCIDRVCHCGYPTPFTNAPSTAAPTTAAPTMAPTTAAPTMAPTTGTMAPQVTTDAPTQAASDGTTSQ